jgi:hypothetical protein
MTFAVVDFAVVDVEEEGAGGGEDAVSFNHSGAQETDEVVELVGVAGGLSGEDLGAVAFAAESGAIAGVVADGFHLLPGLAAAGIEGRVYVD